jgi:tetratricopeptide (TPR) repeat protein
MRRRALWIAAAVAGIFVAGGLAYRAGRAERAQALVQQAERLLHPAFDQAPAFTDVRAPEARTLLEQAKDLDRPAELAALELEANAIEFLQHGNVVAARRALEAAGAPQSPTLGVLLAAVRLAANDVNAADTAIRRVLGDSVRPPSSAANLPAANAGGQQETDVRAITVEGAAKRSDKQIELRALAIASDVARATGQADRALEFAEKGIALQASAALYERRGLARELLGDLRAAKEDFELAAQLDAKLTSPLVHLGRVSKALGDLRSAVLAFTGAAQRNPKESEAWLGAGLCRIGLGDMSGARADLERAEELAPTKAAPLIALGDVDAAERNWDEAERHYTIATKLEPQLALPWLKLGNTSMRKSQIASAVAAYRKAIERQAELAAAHNGLGAALQAQGDAEGAKRELEQAAKLDPNDPNPLLNLARLYRQQGDATAAESALAQAQARSR